MTHDDQERTLSTADLADRPEEAESSREETDGRHDQLVDETDIERGTETTTDTDRTSPLFESGDAQHFQGEWEAIQTAFVDEPRRAVEQADTLVADLMQRLAAGFAHERKQLEAQWDRGNDVSTEDLRLALQRYRSFFGRLLQA